jgi:protein-S-isoprenylcysteine O-methyltransferase Ste14
MKLWIRAIIFTLLIPCSVAGVIPWLLSRAYGAPLDLGPGRLAGAPLLALGIFLYLTSVWSFVVRGGGTPAIWFIGPLRTIIGREPDKLVRGVSYRWTRNPMYLGVVFSVFGQALLFDDLSYHFYAAGLWLIFHLVVTLLEEPHLRKKYGESYVAYCRATPRWLGIPGDKGEPPEESWKTQ